MFIIIGATLFKDKVLSPKESFGEGSMYFIGFLIFGALISFLSDSFSIFSFVVVPSQYLLSSVTAQMPYFWSLFLTNIGAPIAEEIIFLVTIPSIIHIILKVLSKSYPKLKDKYIQMAIIVAITAPLFANFHVGNIGLTGFFIAAVLFRTVQIVLRETEANKTLFGAFGFHAGMNIGSTGGLLAFISVFMTETTGILILLFFGIMAYAGAAFLLNKK